MKFRKKEFEDKSYEKKVRRYILIIVLVTAAPSVYLAYRIVDKSIFENNAKAFILQEINNKDTQVISRTYNYSRKGNDIELLLLGRVLSQAQIDTLKKKMPSYNLQNTALHIKQGLNAKNEVDLSQIKASILETVYQKDSITTVKNASKIELQIPDLSKELRSLYPELLNYSIDNVVIQHLDKKHIDTVTLAALQFKKSIAKGEKLKLESWLKNRIGCDSLKLVLLN